MLLLNNTKAQRSRLIVHVKTDTISGRKVHRPVSISFKYTFDSFDL